MGGPAAVARAGALGPCAYPLPAVLWERAHSVGAGSRRVRGFALETNLQPKPRPLATRWGLLPIVVLQLCVCTLSGLCRRVGSATRGWSTSARSCWRLGLSLLAASVRARCMLLAPSLTVCVWRLPQGRFGNVDEAYDTGFMKKVEVVMAEAEEVALEIAGGIYIYIYIYIYVYACVREWSRTHCAHVAPSRLSSHASTASSARHPSADAEIACRSKAAGRAVCNTRGGTPPGSLLLRATGSLLPLSLSGTKYHQFRLQNGQRKLQGVI